jgi:predicted regulator of Ras-like GTPase activity (Roadblock/LC7/MglB family)
MKVNEAIDELMDVDGAIAAILVDSDSGMVLASKSKGFDTDTAAAGNTCVVQAKRDTMKMLKLDDRIEDMLITLGTQLHLISPLPSNDAIFGYLVVDKKGANLGLARAKLKAVMGSVTF